MNVALNRLLLVVVALGLGGCAGHSRAPKNLDFLKQEIRAYVDQGDYKREIEQVAGSAQEWLQERAIKGGAKLTIVLDLDETLFSNWPHMSAMDFGYVKSEWRKWIDEGKAPAIEPVREIFRLARQLEIDVVLITGRTERDRAGTERNLRAIGCDDYQALVFKPESDQRTSAEYKTAERQLFVAEGRKIVANIGDQESDLAGGFAERTFRLPNPFYLSP